ncbi:hypothetical protein GCM10011611_35300 [Aliidongia dinghuensis]|uniref:Uncharacterized protein n=1 Tax=Aliidongia dinghuensis TaxID=1867774 RepID=A0A8J2YVM4_9PROT|nr:hypothetical protein [Aliidongia dinghuensis]GGF26177.1 hypothetical protein GCM10011611_35300 [Aliidongia dinghuensis]
MITARMTVEHTIEHFGARADVVRDGEEKYPRWVRRSLLVGLASLSWAVVAGVVYLAVQFI